MLANRALLVGLTAMVLASLMLGATPESQPGIESHYHYRMAQRIAAGDLLPSPGDSLPLGPLAEAHPVDHHWGLHVVMIPATWLGDLYDDDYVGLKLGSILFFTLTILGLFLMLRRFAIPHAVALSLVPLAFEALGWRYLQLRGGGLMAIGLLYWAYCAFWLQKARRSVLVSYLLTISYQGAFLMVPLSLAAVIGRFIGERGSFRETAKPALWTLLGVTSGLVAGPYLWDSLSFLVFHLNTAFGDPAGYYGSGHEFSPMSLSMVLSAPEYGLMAILVCVAVVVAYRHRQELDPRIFSIVAMSAALVVLSGRSIRIVEYGVPFALLAVGLVCVGRSYSVRRWYQIALILTASILVANRLTKTVHEGSRGTPTEAYVGMTPLLEAQQGIIGNLYQADFSLILWAHPQARCVQGLNHYFVDSKIRDALDTLKMKGVHRYSSPDHDQKIHDALKLLISKNVSIFTARAMRNGWPHPFVQFAQNNPDWLERIYPDPERVGTDFEAASSFIWAWNPGPALKAP
jgi:hypothetical protein